MKKNKVQNEVICVIQMDPNVKNIKNDHQIKALLWLDWRYEKKHKSK